MLGHKLGLVHTTPKKFENAALFLRLDLPSTHLRHENGAFFFKRAFQTGGIWKRRLFRFRVEGKHFENGAFQKRRRHGSHVISLTEFSSQINPKWPVIVAFLNSPDVVWTENIWCVFRVNPPFSNPSSVVWTKHYTVARLKQRKVQQYARLFQDYKNSPSSSEWSPLEPRAFLHTVTRGFRFWEWFRSWMCPHKMGIRFLRRSFSLCGIFLFLKYIANTASIAMIYDNLQNFKTNRLVFSYKSKRIVMTRWGNRQTSMLASSRALAVIFYFVLLTKSSVRLFKWNIFFCPAVLGVFTRWELATRPFTQQVLHFVILREKKKKKNIKALTNIS